MLLITQVSSGTEALPRFLISMEMTALLSVYKCACLFITVTENLCSGQLLLKETFTFQIQGSTSHTNHTKIYTSNPPKSFTVNKEKQLLYHSYPHKIIHYEVSFECLTLLNFSYIIIFKSFCTICVV